MYVVTAFEYKDSRCDDNYFILFYFISFRLILFHFDVFCFVLFHVMSCHFI